MAEDKNKIVAQRIENAIEQLETKKSALYFFVTDCKNVPNSEMLYIYDMALTLKELGYDVCMVYQLNNEYSKHELKKLEKAGKPIDNFRKFEGVGKWLGEKYAEIDHLNIANSTWRVSPSDFLFIPEAFSSMMKETFEKGIPCKRIAVLQNFKYVTEFIPYGDQWMNYGITDVIASNDNQKRLIESVFPYIKCSVVNPYIQECMRKPAVAKKLIVNIASTKSSDVEHIIKTFYWKYPLMQFVTFRSLRNLNVTEYSDMLKEGCITIWHDPDTPFGRSAIDAIKCGNIVIGKVPEIIPEWMVDDNGEILNNGVWYSSIEQVPDILARVIGSWMRDEVPTEIYDEMNKTAEKYTYAEWKDGLNAYVEEKLKERADYFRELKKNVENKIEKETVENE